MNPTLVLLKSATVEPAVMILLTCACMVIVAKVFCMNVQPSALHPIFRFENYFGYYEKLMCGRRENAEECTAEDRWYRLSF